MSVQTVLLDFSIDPVRVQDEIASKDLLKFIKQGLTKYFENLKFVYDLKTEDGYLCLFTDKNLVFIQIRFFNHGIITINIEYFKGETENQIMSFEVSFFDEQKIILLGNIVDRNYCIIISYNVM